MRMRVDETGNDGASSQINPSGPRYCDGFDLILGSDCEKPAIVDGNSLGARICRIHRQNVGIDENELRLAASERQERQGSKATQEFAARTDHRKQQAKKRSKDESKPPITDHSPLTTSLRPGQGERDFKLVRPDEAFR